MSIFKFFLFLSWFIFLSCQGSKNSLQLTDPADARVDYNSPLARQVHLDPGFTVAGYLPLWKTGKIDTHQLNYLTDVIIFSVSPRADGSFSTPNQTQQNYYDSLKKDYGVRVHLALSDHVSTSSSSPLAQLSRTSAKRKALAIGLTTYLWEKGYAGAVFDWEYPRLYRDKANYILLLKEIKESFSNASLTLGIAVSPWHVLEKEAYQVVDQIHLMTYDDFGRHSTYSGTRIHLQKMIRIYGAPEEKILLGLPFYGRGYTPSIQWKKARTYKTLAEAYNLTPEQDSVAGFYFNGPGTIQDKVRLARDYNLAGVMIWEISQDTPGERSLLKAIAQVQNEYMPFWKITLSVKSTPSHPFLN